MSVAAFRDTVEPRTFTHVGYGDPDTPGLWVWFRRIFRDSGNNHTLPDWQINPRINRFPIPSGGIRVQRGGYDPDSLTLRVELQEVADAATLRAMVGYTNTLTLPDPPYATRGTYESIHGKGYRTITSVLLSAIDPTEGLTVRGNYPRVVLTFEMNRTS